MKIKRGKKGYIISYGDWFKGFFIGLIIGGVLVYLFTNGILGSVKIPAFGTAKETAKMIVPLVPALLRKN
ncbi:hypothetical protein HYV82_01825 [Candidatus Woesearchaeota archaeon]|nr:hypothetical protein [Candidatus Woesearchaeota archaeon]